MSYKDEGFRGVILYGIREEISKTNINSSVLARFPAAVFTTERQAIEYVESAKLVSPQGGGDKPRVSFKKNTVLANCLSYMIGPMPFTDELPKDPEPLESKAEKEEKEEPVKKRKRRTKAEMEAAKAAQEEQPKKRRKRRTKAEMEAARARGEE